MLFLRKNKTEVSVQFSINDLEIIENQIKKTDKEIMNGNFTGSKGAYCQWCDYRELLCPLFG